MQQCFQNKSFPFPSLFLQTSVTSRPLDWHIFDASWTPSCGGNQAAEGNQPALLYIVWLNSSLASSWCLSLPMSTQGTRRTHLPDRLWDSGKALDRCGAPLHLPQSRDSITSITSITAVLFLPACHVSDLTTLPPTFDLFICSSCELQQPEAWD